ncbi:MAG: hypothetical protein R3B06_21180 [Kofleriaceae bacterium]
MADDPDNDTQYRIRSRERIAVERPLVRRDAPTIPTPPVRVAAGSAPELTPPELPPLLRSQTIRFGHERLTIEDHGDRVDLVLPNGARMSGTIDEAHKLAGLLLEYFRTSGR